MNDVFSAEGVRVLVVDDDSEQLEQIRSVLRELGCHVDVAVNGVDAVRKARQHAPELVLMDLGMPEMNGVEAIREIRRDRGASTYIIAVSAYQDADTRRLAFDAGCNEYIIKPLDVRGAVRVYAYRTRASRELARREP